MQRVSEAIKLLESNSDVLGVALTGSQARAGMATELSDTDLIVFATDDSELNLPNLAGVDLAIYRATSATNPVLPSDDFDAWYNRAAFLHARAVSEREPGRVDAWIVGQSTLTESESAHVVAHHLDGYLNLAIRALKSQRDNRTCAAALDSVEAISWGLTTIFALERRVRPFNKYLWWELENYPFAAYELQAEPLLSVVRSVVEGEVLKHRDLLAQIAPVVERAGFATILSDWGDDMDVFAR
jgi:hypothetical protein